MIDLLTALALAMFIEGVMYALFPQRMKRAALLLVSQPEAILRYAGVGIACLGVACVWVIRHRGWMP
jgi:uncharacterized protein YjeT (DUF2065 family)